MRLKAPSVVLAATLAVLAASSCGSSSSTSNSSSSATGSRPGTPAAGELLVAPSSGHRGTTFTFTFKAPQSAGRHGSTRTEYTLAVATRFRTGCLAERTVPVENAVKGADVTISLDPMKSGGLWCRGTYTARVTEVQMPYCSPGTMCPQFVRVVATVGRTTFRVTS
jgi:hypothetical protein